ncbi:uncharacterized protein LOC132979478 isoform X2 [Labrus mixtus]|uniref:uncharacterized protein LOC132979478 isoform X2 n=1 Tax=Labrus mixtus TaxID=508554 RepID=UPI0029BFF942|nr:uncharacterized protein LOC132979478 isoform X2 [Labrus mixtus]
MISELYSELLNASCVTDVVERVWWSKTPGNVESVKEPSVYFSGRMEMMKPEVKKKPPKTLPKPSEFQRNDAERPTPLVPQRPADDELSHTQYRVKNAAKAYNEANGNLTQRETRREKQSETPEVPPRPTENRNPNALSGLFKRSQKERPPSFTKYVTHDLDKEEKTDDAPPKQAPASKQTSREPSPDQSGAEGRSEKDEPAEKNKQEKSSEPKQDIGALFTGMFRKTPKERPASPTLKVSKADSDAEDAEEGEEKSSEQSNEKGNFFSAILKKPAKSTDDKERLSAHSELSASNDSLSENKDKGGIFSGMFKKKPSEAAPTEEDRKSLHDDLSGSNDNLSENSKEKKGGLGGIFKRSASIDNLFDETSRESNPDQSGAEGRAEKDEPAEKNKQEKSSEPKQDIGALFTGMFRKTPKERPASPTLKVSKADSDAEDAEEGEEKSSEQSNEKGNFFSAILKKPAKSTDDKERLSAHSELSASNDSLSENKDKGGIFSGMFKKKPSEAAPTEEDRKSLHDDLSGSNDNLSENSKEKKGGLGGIFKRSASIDNLFDEEKGGLFSGLRKKTPKASGDDAAAEDEQKELTASTDSLSENGKTKEKSIFSGMFKKTPKAAAEGNTTDDELDPAEDNRLSASCENLLEASTSKEKSGGLGGIFRRSPKPSPKPSHRSITSKDPLTASCDSLADTAEGDFGDNDDNLSDATGTSKERKGGFAGRFRRHKPLEHQESEDLEAPAEGGLRRRRTIKKKRRVTSFRVKKTSKVPNLLTQSSDKMPAIEEIVEMQDLNSAQESSVEVQPVEMAAYPTEANPLVAEEQDELIEWWNTVKGWVEWNETSDFQGEDGEAAMEQAADRVYMAARLFVRLFNQRGASLQHRILELLALADAADLFHKKTVSIAVGGGVASVCGSVATITGLILAPFTFGASIIVTAVGIGVATAGSITSASANITDTVHSNMDRKKLEKMIQDYQEEIKDIREVMEFVQAGMDTLQEWDFEKYSESAAKKAMNHNLKHVMKEGGRAGKALMINTDKLISTVQVLGAAGGAAKAAQAISVTTGVMSALFLALDVFFLAKDSHDLRKGAKTKFAKKIRDVCTELQDGLLALNKVKTQLQKTMEGIEVEEYEDFEEVEVEVDDDFESDPKKLAELEKELDLLEEKLDKRVEEEQKRKKEEEELKKKKEEEEMKKKKEEEELKRKKEEEEEKRMKEKEEKELKLKNISDKEEEQENETVKDEEESEKGKKKDKENENWITAAKEKLESKRDKTKEDKLKEKNKSGKEQKEAKSRSGDSKQEDRSEKVQSERVMTGRESERSRSHREEEKEMKPEWKSVNKERETEGGSTARRRGSRSDQDKPNWRESKHQAKESDSSSNSGRVKESDRMESWRRTEEERGVKDWRAEMAKREEKSREGKESRREDEGKGDVKRESHRSHETVSSRREHSEREWGSSRGSDSKRSHHRRGSDDQKERGDEKRESRMESARKKSERAEGERGGEEEEDGVKRREDRERRGSDREHRHSHRGSRSRANALLEDGLNI